MSVLQDIRLALRLLRRSPAASAIALLSIAVSTGAVALVFTAIRPVLIEPLPYARPNRLVQIGTHYPKIGDGQSDWVFWNDVQAIARDSRTLSSTAAYRYAMFTLAGGNGALPEALYGLRVTANLFPTLGVAPMLGRNIAPDDDQPNRGEVIILSHGLWSRRFNSDRSVIGRTIVVNGHNCTVIGVMAPDFDFPLRKSTPVRTPSPYMEFWAPMAVDPRGNQGGLGGVARLRDDATLADAQQEIAAIGATLAQQQPATNRDRGLRAFSMRDRVLGTARTSLLLLLAVSVLFMLIGCSNVANLVLARGVSRRHEMAVRIAIGAGRGRLVRQLLTESLVLSALGGLAGYALVTVAWKLLLTAVPPNVPRLAAAQADWTTFAVAFAVGIISGGIFGLAPALRAATGLGIRGEIGSRDRTRSSFLAAQVALAMLLVITGGQLVAGFGRLVTADLGFDTNGVIASVVLAAGDQYNTSEARGILYRRIVDSVRAIPGVDSAGTVDALPFSGENHGGFASATAEAALRPGGQISAEVDAASPGYLETLHARLLDGRWFHDEERMPSSDAAIVSDSVASALWPGELPIGKRICVFCTPELPSNWKRVVGVVASTRHSALDKPAGNSIYLSGGAYEQAQFLVVHSNHPTSEIGAAIRDAIADIDPNQPVFLTAPISSFIADSVADRRFVTTLLTAIGLLAWGMSVIGVYGVISYVVSCRRQEIGLRMALGANLRDMHALVFRQGFAPVSFGLLSGGAAAFASTVALRSALPGLGAIDIKAAATAALMVTLAAAFACWIPARRAAKVDPMAALRQDS